MCNKTNMEMRSCGYVPKFNTALYEVYQVEIIESFMVDYAIQIELTNNDLTDALLLESRDNFYRVRDMPVEQCIDEITNHLVRMYQYVNGDLDQYGPDSRITKLMRKLMISEPIVTTKKDKRPNILDYQKAILRVIKGGVDLANNKEAFKKYLFLNIKAVELSNKVVCNYKCFRDIEFRLGSFYVLAEMLAKLTPAEFMQMFPVDKIYNGMKYGWKDYFSTIESLKEYDLNQPIGKERIMYFIWDYSNDTIIEFEVARMCYVNALQCAKGGQGI